nr:MAG TPA: hypothetical protein [Caudoviricetes sp.]
MYEAQSGPYCAGLDRERPCAARRKRYAGRDALRKRRDDAGYRGHPGLC